MPTYVYENHDGDGHVIRVVPISERESQTCEVCGEPLKRVFKFTGLTWAPTAGGMR